MPFKIAEFLLAHPAVQDGLLPGACPIIPGTSSPPVKCATSAAMVSFTVARRRAGDRSRWPLGTEIFTLAESLGAVESLIELPARMTHASTAGSELEVDPSLIRLSVGLETR